MPIYEYRCKSCNCEYEYLKLSDKDPEPPCPSCCGTESERLISSGAIRPHGIPGGKGGFTPPKCRPSGG